MIEILKAILFGIVEGIRHHRVAAYQQYRSHDYIG